MLPVGAHGYRLQAHRAITPNHGGRGRGGVGGDHQSLGRGEGVASVGIGLAGKRGGTRGGTRGRCGGWGMACGEGLAGVTVVTGVGVGVIVGLGVVPVAAVVCVGGG